MPGSVIAAVATGVIGSAFADDHGAEGANDAARDATQMQTEIAADQWGKYKQIYEPLERKFVSDAEKADRPEAFKQAASDASAVVSTQFGRAKQRLARQPGMDPSTPGYQANLAGLELAQAATDSVEQNRARKGVEDTAFARKHTALSLGKGLDTSAAAGLSSAARTNAGLADMGWERGQQDAAAIGQIADEVVSAGSDWLKNRKKTGT